MQDSNWILLHAPLTSEHRMNTKNTPKCTAHAPECNMTAPPQTNTAQLLYVQVRPEVQPARQDR